MGQYYKVVNTELMQWYHPDWLKLMEHSWLGNECVGKIMRLLSPGGDWYKAPIVWCGDYYSEYGEIPYYDLVKSADRVRPEKTMTRDEQLQAILVNHTKLEYTTYQNLPKNKDGWVINPLPLLTACGNNRGGGDYYDSHPDFDKVGIWANDRLSVETEIPYGYWHLKVNFIEIR
jgi:hypothetical protein